MLRGLGERFGTESGAPGEASPRGWASAEKIGRAGKCAFIKVAFHKRLKNDAPQGFLLKNKEKKRKPCETVYFFNGLVLLVHLFL